MENKEKTLYEKLFNIKIAWIKLQRLKDWYWYKYATLNQIQEKLWEYLEKEKLLITHKIENNKVITEIIDLESKESIKSEIEMTDWVKAQDKWSEITYFRRYNLLALLDLETEDDDWKKAQDSKKVVNNTDTELPRINSKNIEDIKKLIFTDWKKITMGQVREKYKVSNANAEILEKILHKN